MKTTHQSPTDPDTRALREGRTHRPTNRETLKNWVQLFTGLKLPDKPLCPNHSTPLDYLEYVFFENNGTANNPPPTPPNRTLAHADSTLMHADDTLAHADPQQAPAQPPEAPADTGDVVVWACRGGGKTMIGAVATLLDMLFKPGTQIRILGGSQEQSSKMYAYLRALVDEHFADHVKGRITHKGFTFTNGSRVEILAQSHTAVRGTRVQKMRCDEVELFDPEVWEAAQLTTRSLTAGDAIQDADGSEVVSRGCVEVYSTMHRVGGLMSDLMQNHADDPERAGRKVFAWCIWDVIEACHPRRKCETCVLWSECRGRARQADGFVRVADVVAMKRRASRRAWESEMLCFRPYTEARVFEAFDRAVHVRAFPLDGVPAAGVRVSFHGGELRLEGLIAGMDFGWRTFACVWVAMLRDGRGERVVWVLDSYAAATLTLAAHAQAIGSRGPGDGMPWKPAVVYCDVAGRQHDSHTGETSEATLRHAGFRVKSRAMAIEDGIGMLNVLMMAREGGGEGEEALVMPRFYVDPRCGELIAALEAYRRDSKGKPVKDGTHDHIVDALRYALVGHDGRAGGKVEARLY